MNTNEESMEPEQVERQKHMARTATPKEAAAFLAELNEEKLAAALAQVGEAKLAAALAKMDGISIAEARVKYGLGASPPANTPSGANPGPQQP